MNKYQVKILEAGSSDGLERMIQEFLYYNEDITIHEIKYNHVGRNGYTSTFYSCLILYKEG